MSRGAGPRLRDATGEDLRAADTKATNMTESASEAAV